MAAARPEGTGRRLPVRPRALFTHSAVSSSIEKGYHLGLLKQLPEGLEELGSGGLSPLSPGEKNGALSSSRLPPLTEGALGLKKKHSVDVLATLNQ